MISKARLTRSKGAIQYLLEAKISSYKLYDNSLVSLIPKHGWLSDEVKPFNKVYVYYLRILYIISIVLMFSETY